jgi:hypothetical protein
MRKLIKAYIEDYKSTPCVQCLALLQVRQS